MVKLIYDLVKFVKNIEIDGILFENNGQNISIVEVINKYNSTKRLSLKISIDDKISKKYDKITYICPICNSESKILVCRFIHKKTNDTEEEFFIDLDKMISDVPVQKSKIEE